MTLDLGWLNEHYLLDGAEWPTCRRCGKPVGYVTKHAAKRHGDEIQVLPPVPHANPEAVKLW